MKRISDINFCELVDIEKLQKAFGDEIPQKRKVIDYFSSVAATDPGSGWVTDRISGERTFIYNAAFYDGDYCWTSAEPYYFEKYNLRLDNDFIDYVLRKTEVAV